MAELWVVATPIGNLGDMSERVRAALADCDLIAAEDTRVTMKLLNHLGIKKPLISCHRHNEQLKMGPIIERMLAEDQTVCLTCDAGTPGISDPGHLLVAAAIEAGIRVVPIAGPSAVTAHLSACGFDAREFAFYGFLPREGKALREKLKGIIATGVPIAVLYESPHRVVKLVEAIGDVVGPCRISVACDLTKRYEKILTGPVAEVLAALRDNPNTEKGEYSVVLDLSGAKAPKKQEAMPVEAYLFLRVLDGLSLDDAARQAQAADYARNDVYKARLKLKSMGM